MALAEKVLVAGNIHADGLSLFEKREGLSVEITEAFDESTLAGLVSDVHAILVRSARISAAVIDSAPNLKVVSRHGVGFNSVDVDALTARGIPLAIAVGGNAISVAEQTFYLILTLAKQGNKYDAAARRGDFSYRHRPLTTEISGKSLLIVGFGRIGTRVASRALAFDMSVLRHTFHSSAINTPQLEYACSWKLSKIVWPDLQSHRLNCLAEFHNIELDHHNAGSDAKAAAELLKLAFEKDDEGFSVGDNV